MSTYRGKLTPDHFAHLRAVIREAQAKQPTETRAKYEEVGMNAQRHRWDLFHCSKVVRYVCDHIYPYANDTHIDAALRAIVKEMEDEQS